MSLAAHPWPALSLLAASVYFGWHVRSLLLAFASRDWPVVRGQLLACYVDELPLLPGEDRDDGYHSANVRYAYKVRGTTYVSKRLSYRPTRWILFADALDYLHDLRTGAQVDVFYDPRHPGRAVLLPGPSDDNILRVAFALVLLAAAVWFCWSRAAAG